MKRITIQKYDTSSADTTTMSEDESEDDFDYTLLTNINYKKPRGGTVQDNFTKEDIKAKLKGYIPLKTMKEKKMLNYLTPFKTWIRYINTTSRLFRTGGLLMKVQYPDYITLANPTTKISWSVQLADNILFIHPPETNLKKEQTILPIIKMTREQEKEQRIKDKLYKMYLKGELQCKK